jgi:hypothetical protein
MLDMTFDTLSTLSIPVRWTPKKRLADRSKRAPAAKLPRIRVHDLRRHPPRE